jgi:hypothetical protein
LEKQHFAGDLAASGGAGGCYGGRPMRGRSAEFDRSQGRQRRTQLLAAWHVRQPRRGSNGSRLGDLTIYLHVAQSAGVRQNRGRRRRHAYGTPRQLFIGLHRRQQDHGFGRFLSRLSEVNQGVNNEMLYVNGNIPSGTYDPNRLANFGAGCTYLAPKSGHEFPCRRPDLQRHQRSTAVSKRHRFPC